MTIWRYLLWSFVLFQLVFIQATCHQARASSDETGGEAFLRNLLQVQSASQISVLKREDEQSQNVILVCRVQLKGTRIPVACFEALARAKRSKKIEPERGSLSQNAWLDRVCEERVRSSEDMGELERGLASQWISSSCRARLQDRLGDLRYAAESSDPSQLLIRSLRRPASVRD